MKNTLTDLNNHLFAQLEKLGDDDLTCEELNTEIKRSEAMSKIGECIGCNAYRYRRDKDLELTELEYCQKRCRAYRRAQKRLRRRTEDDTN